MFPSEITGYRNGMQPVKGVESKMRGRNLRSGLKMGKEASK
jgi:hypothetical protein